MKPSKALLLGAALISAAALADVGLKNAGTSVGNVLSLDCVRDGGLACGRGDGGVGRLSCVGATATAAGCMTPSTQTLGGDKTFTGADGGTCSIAGGSLTCTGTVSGAPPASIRYGTCPEAQTRWALVGGLTDGGTVVGTFQALDPSGGRIDSLQFIDNGGTNNTDGGSDLAYFTIGIYR